MVDPIQGPHSPSEWDEEQSEPRGLKGHGAKLFRKVSDLYFFCMAKDVVAPSDRYIYTTLAKIMQISKHSATYGDYITDRTEQNAADMIAEVKESLRLKNIPRQIISTKLKYILDTITEDSRKARLMETLTDIEMYFMNPETGATDEELEALRGKVSLIVEKLTPDTQDINAEAIHRDLRDCLKDAPPPAKILNELDLCFKRWLQ